MKLRCKRAFGHARMIGVTCLKVRSEFLKRYLFETPGNFRKAVVCEPVNNYGSKVTGLILTIVSPPPCCCTQ